MARRSAPYINLIFLVFIVFSGAGCRTLKAPSKPFEIWTAPEWERTSRTADLVWTSIRGQRIAASEPLALIDLLEIAIRNNPVTRRAWEEARAGEAEQKQAESRLYPQVEGTAEIARQLNEADLEIDDQEEIYHGPAGKLTYLVLDFGGRSFRIKEAFQKSLAANFQFNQALQDLILETEKGYYGLYSAKSEVEAAEADVEDAKTAFNAARQRYDVGLVSKLDVLQAESDYDDSLYTLEDAKGQVKTAKGDLAKTLGLSADTPFEIIAPSRKIPTDVTKEDVSQLIEKALDKRPDIAAGRASLRAKEAAVKAANSDLWPTLDFGLSTDAKWYRYFDVEKEVIGHKYGNAQEYSGYLSVTWDVFDGFYNLARRRQAQAESNAEREKLIQAELEASADVWNKYYNFKTAVKKLTFSEAFLKSSETAHDLAVEGYNVGLKSILDLLQAQRNLSAARSRLIQSRKDLFFSLAELAHATGTLYVKGDTVTASPEEIDRAIRGGG